MSNQSVLIIPDFENDVDDRGKLWSQFDEAQNDANNLRNLREKVPQSSKASELGPFTVDKRSPDELAMAIQKLEEEIREMDRLQNSIRNAEQSIREIEEHYRTMIMWLIISGIVIIALIIFTQL
jgi:CHASE3 domain sensor protein